MGRSAEERLAVRQRLSRPLVADLVVRVREQRPLPSLTECNLKVAIN
jgi:hypothetical protein